MANGWNRTRTLWCQKQLLCHLWHNSCPSTCRLPRCVPTILSFGLIAVSWSMELFRRSIWTTGSAQQSNMHHGILPCMCFIYFLRFVKNTIARHLGRYSLDLLLQKSSMAGEFCRCTEWRRGSNSSDTYLGEREVEVISLISVNWQTLFITILLFLFFDLTPLWINWQYSWKIMTTEWGEPPFFLSRFQPFIVKHRSPYFNGPNPASFWFIFTPFTRQI